jgi:hypothetical protein
VIREPPWALVPHPAPFPRVLVGIVVALNPQQESGSGTMLVGAIIALLFIFGLFFSMVSASPKVSREDTAKDLFSRRRI